MNKTAVHDKSRYLGVVPKRLCSILQNAFLKLLDSHPQPC